MRVCCTLYFHLWLIVSADIVIISCAPAMLSWSQVAWGLQHLQLCQRMQQYRGSHGQTSDGPSSSSLL